MAISPPPLYGGRTKILDWDIQERAFHRNICKRDVDREITNRFSVFERTDQLREL